MHNTRSITILEMNQLLKASTVLSFQAKNKTEAYAWIENLLQATAYKTQTKKDKGIVRNYAMKMTGYSDAQLERMIKQYALRGNVRLKAYQRHSFSRTFTDADITLLAETDDAHGILSGPATAKIMSDELHLFGDQSFERLADIAPSHIYNLRKARLYREKVRVYVKTKPTQAPIGTRQKPRPNGIPGYLRVDSVHGGDKHDGTKGVYFINLVDEVLQWEVVICVEGISERFMKDALQAALVLLPFVVHSIHSDNGSEYINYQVAGMLEKIRVGLTKSRPRKSNDNALVESKNGSVIRKYFGYAYIPKKFAPDINAFCQLWFNPYLNFHRPCGFAEEVIMNKHGKKKRRYPHHLYLTPYAKLKSLPNAKQYLKTDITFEGLDKKAYAVSHTKFAQARNKAKEILFKKIFP